MERPGEAADSGVVDQNIEPPENAFNLLGEALDLLPLRDISQQSLALTAGAADALRGLIERPLSPASDRDGSAQPSQTMGNGRPNATAASGDYRDFIFE